MTARVPFDARLRLLTADGRECERFQATFEICGDAVGIQPASGAPSTVDFAEVDFLLPDELRFGLALEGGTRLEFSMLGRRFDEAFGLLSERLRDFQNRALFLDEAEGGERFEGWVKAADISGAAEVRLYRTRLSAFPREHVPFAIALGEVARASFNEDRYAVDLELRDGGRVSVGKLGRATQAFFSLLEERLSQLRGRVGDALGSLAPGLSFGQTRQLAALLPDGVPAIRRDIDGIVPGLFDRLTQAVLAPELVDSVRFLDSRSLAGEQALAFKEVHGLFNLDTDGGDDDDTDLAAGRVHLGDHLAFFLFPIAAADRTLPGNAIAVEVASRTGRATYLFRIAARARYASLPFDELAALARTRVIEVARDLVALGFRRSPIHLSDEAIRQPRHQTLRLALRHVPALSALRSAFIGRVIHGPGWRERVEALLAAD